MEKSGGETLRLVISLATIALLAGNLLIFGRIAAGIGRISDQLAAGALSPPDPVIVKIPIPADVAPSSGSVSAQASGNIVNVAPAAPALRPGPRTVEQVADYLGVTADTVRESYIPVWILDGHMDETARLTNRWMIPDTFTPYRAK
jgi:hypothetical protein